MSEIPVSLAVNCYTCYKTIWQGNEFVEPDGQKLLTAYADSVPGTTCPSGIAPCPHKAAVLVQTAKLGSATIKDLELVTARIAKLEKADGK